MCVFCLCSLILTVWQIFQKLMNRGKYAYVVLWVKNALRKSFCVCKIAHRYGRQNEKPGRITVSVF